ncbi:hypothetical protein C9374_003969 [Naegleria lovaniensis]|uniref:Uncharacterized protein n=1 Tax=Naegleria lovaniensis TaxID=51637 RepID=A0AA88H085_NAELO|nr:uncharacterized protein C9374_003969 [Naegleria lovaniensis]KAG2394205.1 hypothetical protein C9374_003969 [Naegleria lovaniensis]
MGNSINYKHSQNNMSEEELRNFYQLNTRLDVNRSLFSMGHNSKGQLALGEVSKCRNIARPFPVINPNGSDNTYGQLGTDEAYTEIVELKLEQYGLMTCSKSIITCVDAGDYFTFFGVSNALHGHQLYTILKREDHPLCDVVIGFNN